MTTARWDQDVVYRSFLVTAPTDLPVEESYFRDKYLRETSDDDTQLISDVLGAATRACEEHTGVIIMPQTWKVWVSAFPTAEIVLPKMPLISVDAFEYVDSGGTTQELAGSPAEYLLTPSAQWYGAELAPLPTTTWPATQARPDAVRITYQVGHPNIGDVPVEYLGGIYLMAAELFVQRSMSVHAVHNTPSTIQPDRFWRQVRQWR